MFANFNAKKAFKGTLSGLRQFLATESPLKLMKNAFLSNKLFPFSGYLNVCLDVLVMLNGLIKGYFRYKTIFCHEVALDV